MQIKKYETIRIVTKGTPGLGYQYVTVDLTSYGFKNTPIPIIQGFTIACPTIEEISAESVKVRMLNPRDAETGTQWAYILLVEFSS